jgi:hypothetical protein
MCRKWKRATETAFSKVVLPLISGQKNASSFSHIPAVEPFSKKNFGANFQSSFTNEKLKPQRTQFPHPTQIEADFARPLSRPLTCYSWRLVTLLQYSCSALQFRFWSISIHDDVPDALGIQRPPVREQKLMQTTPGYEWLENQCLPLIEK